MCKKKFVIFSFTDCMKKKRKRSGKSQMNKRCSKRKGRGAFEAEAGVEVNSMCKLTIYWCWASENEKKELIHRRLCSSNESIWHLQTSRATYLSPWMGNIEFVIYLGSNHLCGRKSRDFGCLWYEFNVWACKVFRLPSFSVGQWKMKYFRFS